MSTPLPRQAPDYDDAESALADQRGLFGIADGHGLLCGLLCGQPGLSFDEWLRVLFNGPPPGFDRTVLEALYEATRARLTVERFDFNPLLPDDEEPLARRVTELGRWCQGFLTGLGLSEATPRQLTSDADEFLRDVAQIARATLSSDESEAQERDYAEVVEYVRVGVMLVRDALHHTRDAGERVPHARPH